MSIAASDRAAVVRFVRECGAGVVATIGPDGGPQAAYVGLTASDDGVLVFDAAEDSRKVANISGRPRVALTVTRAELTIQIEGRARITRGEERRRLGEMYNEHFPGSRALDAGFAVLAVDVSWVRAYDAESHPPRVTESSWARPAD